jgi:alanine-glyoxylate transaminase/serine-glyoxylate transaminase/serine-pyruvate transaminase
LNLLEAEGLEKIFQRHARHAEATRRAVKTWGLETVCAEPSEYSQSVTAVFAPDGHSADALRKVILERFNMSLGAGLGKLADKVFRIGHLGDFNDLMLSGTLSGVEMGLALGNIPHKSGGILAALDHLSAQARLQAAA